MIAVDFQTMVRLNGWRHHYYYYCFERLCFLLLTTLEHYETTWEMSGWALEHTFSCLIDQPMTIFMGCALYLNGSKHYARKSKLNLQSCESQSDRLCVREGGCV